MVGNVNALQMGPLGSKSPNMQSPNQQVQSSIANNMMGGHHVIGGNMPNNSMANNSNVPMQGEFQHRFSKLK
jgi:hypothetical protein